MWRDQRGYSGSVDLVRRRLQELLPPTERRLFRIGQGGAAEDSRQLSIS
jgi:hypothetical protein